jgi:hypothetical protein
MLHEERVHLHYAPGLRAMDRATLAGKVKLLHELLLPYQGLNGFEGLCDVRVYEWDGGGKASQRRNR